MEGKFLPDNLNGQEIRELLDRKNIRLEDLDLQALDRLFAYETARICKNGGDDTLLCRCADLLCERNGISEESEQRCAEMLRAALDSVTERSDAEHTGADKPTLGNFRAKKVLLIAAALVTLVCSATIAAAALGFDVVSYLGKIVAEPVGTELSVDSVTFVHYGESIQYASIEELVRSESLNILIPSELPDGIEMTEVGIVTEKDSHEFIYIVTNNADTAIQIETPAKAQGNSFGDSERYEVNGITFFIVKDLNSAFCYCEDSYYSINANTYENLLFIIEHMKELH